MSDTSTNLLSGFQATTSKGGGLLGDATLLSGETTDDSAVAFSNALNQAQSNQADEWAEDTTQSAESNGRLVNETKGDQSSNARDELKLTESAESDTLSQSSDGRDSTAQTNGANDSSDLLNSSELRRTLEALEESTAVTDPVKPSALSNSLNENVGQISTVDASALRNNGHIPVNPVDSDRLSPVQEVSEILISESSLETASGRATDVAISNSSSQRAAPADSIQAETLQSISTADSLIGDGLPVMGTPVAAPIVSDSDSPLASSGSPSSVISSSVLIGGVATQATTATVDNSVEQQPVISAAAVANRLNVQPFASAAQLSAQVVAADPTAEVGTDAQQLTTIAGIQSVQAGITGLAQSSVSPSAVTNTSTAVSVETLNSAVSPPTASGTTVSASAANVTNDQSITGISGAANSNASVALMGASNIPQTAAKELPAALNVANNATGLATPAPALNANSTMAAAALTVTNEISPTVSINPSLDNMLSALPSGIVTAPILAKADLTGTPLTQTPLNVPLLTPAAPDAMAGNVRWMVGEGVQNAVVNVSPNGMGPISMQIGIEKELMSISIVASQSNTREALESMLPRLRDQLSTQGVETVRVDISDGRGERSGNFAGFERQHMGYTTADNNQNSQQRSSDEQDQENNSMEFTDSHVNDSGERTLSDTERALVDQLKNSSTNSSVKNVLISHGYDLYV